MTAFRNRLKVLIWLFMALLLVYTLQRLLFIVYNRVEFDFAQDASLINTLVHGMRFDISAILMTNGIFTLLWLFPLFFNVRVSKYSTFLFWIFMSVNSFFITLNFVDIIYFPFVQKRIQSDAFLFVTGEKGTEVFGLIPEFISQFWYIWVLLFLFLYGLNRFWFKTIHPYLHKESISNISIPAIGVLLFVFGLYAFGMRGGTQLRPLSLLDASSVSGIQNAPFVLNSSFSLIRTWKKPRLQEKNYVSPKELRDCASPVKIVNVQNDTLKKPLNVVILLVESLSSQYLSYFGGTAQTPFLDSLMNESFVFANGFANARESVQGIPSVLASVPHWMDEPFIFSRYAINEVNSIAAVLKKHQYNSFFFHGASNGTMGFNSFVKSTGFENYIGMEEYQNQNHFDGSWGIWDHHFLPFMVNKLSEIPQPFVASVLTLNSHHPFRLPKDFVLKNKNKKYPILNMIPYVDKTLEDFFEKAKTKDWFSNTVFVITADHVGPNTLPQKSVFDEFRVPIIFYWPDGRQKGVTEELMSHVDIFPTLLPLLGFKDTIVAFGNNFFDNRCPKKVINYKGNIYQITKDQFHLFFNGEKSIGLYEWKKDKYFKNNLILSKNYAPVISEMELELKKSIQSYHHSLIHNKMTPSVYLGTIDKN